MKLYKITAQDMRVGRAVAWEGTQADAKAKAKDMQSSGAVNIKTETVEFPTDKPGLLVYLNEHFNRDD